jgi:protein SCO1
VRRAQRCPLVAALLAPALLLTACRAGTPPDDAAHVGDAAHASHGAHDAAASTDGLPLAQPSPFSVFELDASWTDQHGITRPLASLAGRPHVMALVYTHCAYACPRILADMKRLEAELGAAAAAVGFVLVSLDPDRDTPARLSEYAAATRLDPAQWTLLTASPDAVLELAMLLGVRYRREGADFEHSNVLTVLDDEGRIVHRQVGLASDPAQSARLLTRLTQRPVSPWD